MKEIPILFSTHMVQALLEGRKTQTRRLIKWPKVPDWHDWDYEPNQLERPQSGGWWPYFYHRNGGRDISGPLKCPYGQGGNMLWVRETHYAYGWWIQEGTTKTGQPGWTFKDFTPEDHGGRYHFVNCPPKEVIEKRKSKVMGWYKRPAIFMPYNASRIWLQKDYTKVEKACDISEEDAIAEGVEKLPFGFNIKIGKQYQYTGGTAKESFRLLWNDINGPETWNDWVWIVSFKVLSTTGKPDLNNL